MFVGPYPGIIEAVDDGDRRYRYRVRVAGVDFDDVPTEALNWADFCAPFSAKLAGDFPHYEVGDHVWVQYRGGNAEFPVIMGGWITESGELNDVPSDATVDYANDRRRWLRIDRIGNTLEMSEVPGEEWTRLRSGSAEVRVSSKDGSVRFFAKSSVLGADARRIDLNAKSAMHQAETFLITARAYSQLGGSTGLLQLLSNYEIVFHAETDAGGNGRVNVGGYVPSYKGASDPVDPTMIARQTPEVNLLGRVVNNGAAAGLTQGVTAPVPMNETEQNNVRAKAILIQAEPPVNASYPSTTVRIHINAMTGQVDIESDVKVTVQAPEVDVTASVKVSISAPLVDLGS